MMNRLVFIYSKENSNMVNEYNKSCYGASTCFHQDLCADIKVKKQSLEIEIDNKERYIENKHQENRQLKDIKQELEQENDFIEEELEKFIKKINILEAKIYAYKKKYHQHVDELSKLNNTLEKFNTKNIKLNEIEVDLKEAEIEAEIEAEYINNIAVSYRDNGDLYLLYKEGASKVYINIASLSSKKNTNNIFSLDTETIIPKPFFIFDTKKNLCGKGVFSTLQEENMAYLTHQKGVLKLSIKINAQTNQLIATCDEIFNEITYGNKQVGKDTSLIDFHGYPFIANGKYILNENPKAQDGNDTGSRYCSSTGMLTSDKPNVDVVWWLQQWRSNPIIEYFEQKFYVIGGNPYPVKHPVEVRTYAKKPTPGFRNYSALIPGAANPLYPFDKKEKQEEAKCLLSVNSETHAHCRLGGKIFIFPRDLFQTESALYYIYDVDKAEINKREVSADFVKNVKAYSDFQVAPHEEKDIIYIVLTKSTAEDFSTQIIIFNASALDNEHSGKDE